MRGVSLAKWLLAALALPAAAAALSNRTVETAAFTLVLPPGWEVLSDPMTGKDFVLVGGTAGASALFTVAVKNKGPRDTADVLFLREYESISRRETIEREDSANSVFHRAGVGVRLVTRDARGNVTVRRLLVFEEAGRLCVAKVTAGGRNSAEAERRYRALAGPWEEMVGAMAIREPATK